MCSTYARRIRFEQLESRDMLAFLAGDYNLSGEVNNGDYNEWQANFGRTDLGTEAPVDGNGDGVIDSADYVVWQKNVGKTLADVPPDAPRLVEARAVGATSIGVTWQASANTTSYAVQRRAPDTESEFTTIAPSVGTTTYTDTTAASDTLYEYRLLAQNSNGASQASQTAQATTNRSNLTAYRPQQVHDLESPADAPAYDPFPKRRVLEQDENSNTLGPGIRINFDDDNNSGVADAFESGNEIPRENDLIEVKVDRLPGLGNLVLVAGSDLSLYYNHDKETPIPLNETMTATEALPFVNNTITVFVEWNNSSHGLASLSLVNPATSTTLDTVRFHTFRSVIVAFGGNGQNPADADGDGSIGDPVQGGPNREGLFDIAQAMYDTGWDVLAFNEEDVDAGDDIPYIEILNARQNRFVERHAVIGYSQGGGATHDLIERIYEDTDIITDIGVFLDAVDHDGAFAENDWPDVAFYLLNIYQDNQVLSGDDIDNDEVFPGATLEEIEIGVTGGFPGNLDHSSIDDDPAVQTRIRTRLQQILINR